MVQPFVLQPFPGTGKVWPNFAITGKIERQVNSLVLTYQVQGEIDQLIIPAKAEAPSRRHNLWESTCFECFVSPHQQERYWEVNLSPSGDWNVYRFDRYREGMQEELRITAIPFRTQQSARELQIGLELDLHPIVAPEQRLDVAITVVTQSLESTVTYWALTHTGREADFHRRDSFTIGI